MTGAAVVVVLANAGRPTRPRGARHAASVDPFEHAESATRLLAADLGRPVGDRELDGLRKLSREVGRIAESLADGLAPPYEELNRLASDCAGRCVLGVNSAGALEADIVWEAGPAAAVLARRVIEELGAIEPSRLRRCARPECGLIFYDSTRPGTQRWHSEVPCGWRERQQRRRARARRPAKAAEA